MNNKMSNPDGKLGGWQKRIFSTVWITYFAYYLCRYNMPIAKTRMCETFSWNAVQFGQILSALLLMYAVGQFVNGQLADRFGTRIIASLGVLGSVIMNLLVFAVVMVSPDDGLSSEMVWVGRGAERSGSSNIPNQLGRARSPDKPAGSLQPFGLSGSPIYILHSHRVGPPRAPL